MICSSFKLEIIPSNKFRIEGDDFVVLLYCRDLCRKKEKKMLFLNIFCFFPTMFSTLPRTNSIICLIFELLSAVVLYWDNSTHLFGGESQNLLSKNTDF